MSPLLGAYFDGKNSLKHEVSVLVAPVADGRAATPALFHIDGDRATPRKLALETVERRDGDVLWLRYRVE